MKIQTKAQANALAKKLFNKINSLEKTKGYTQWLIAEQYYLLNFSVAWKLTTEGTFHKYCNKHSNYGVAHINRYVRAFNIATRLGYTHKELKTIADNIAFRATLKIFDGLQRKLAVRTLIAEYKASVPLKLLPQNEIALINRFSFTLDDMHTKQLIKLLEEHGLYISKMQQKKNISSAMMRWLDTL